MTYLNPSVRLRAALASFLFMLFAFGAAPTVASADTRVSYFGEPPTLLIRSDDPGATLTVTHANDNYRIVDHVNKVTAVEPCQQTSDHQVDCPGANVVQVMTFTGKGASVVYLLMPKGIVTHGGETKVKLDRSSGNDLVSTGPGADDVNLGPGHDSAFLAGGRDIGKGGAGDDTIVAGAGKRDLVKGDGGNDVLFGSPRADTLIGGGGAKDTCAPGLLVSMPLPGCEKRKPAMPEPVCLAALNAGVDLASEPTTDQAVPFSFICNRPVNGVTLSAPGADLSPWGYMHIFSAIGGDPFGVPCDSSTTGIACTFPLPLPAGTPGVLTIANPSDGWNAMVIEANFTGAFGSRAVTAHR